MYAEVHFISQYTFCLLKQNVYCEIKCTFVYIHWYIAFSQFIFLINFV